MNKQQLETNIANMRRELAEMEKQLQEANPKYAVPGEDCFGYLLTGTGSVGAVVELEAADRFFAQGNWAATKEEAEKLAERQRAYWRVVRALRDHEGDFVADWNNRQSGKFVVFYDSRKNEFNIAIFWECIYTLPELHSSEQSCQWVIENMRDDLRIIFGVE